MRFAVDAGIRNPEAQQLIRDLSLPVGVGLFGHSVETGEVVVSGDYRRDKRFDALGGRGPDRRDRRTCSSMAAAPLIAEGEVLGALGAYSSRIDDFDEAEVALLRALADHAAAAIANQQLIEHAGAVAGGARAPGRRAAHARPRSPPRSRRSATRTRSCTEMVEAARRLLGSDGAHLTLMEPSGSHLRPTVRHRREPGLDRGVAPRAASSR